MDIGDWKSTYKLGALYREIRELGLESNVAELDAFGFTILEPGRAAPVSFFGRLRDRVLDIAERRTGIKHDIEKGTHGQLDQQPAQKNQYLLYYLLYEDPVFQEAICNPYLIALQTYMLGRTCQISSVSSIIKWKDDAGYGPTLGLHGDTPVHNPTHVGKNTHTGNANWLLTDYTHEGGCLAFVPGSHRRVRQPAPGEGVDEAIPIEAPFGSLVVWNGNMWHGAFPRQTDGLRVNVTTYFMRDYLMPQEDYRSTVTQEILDRNPKRLATLVGLGNPNYWSDKNGPDYIHANQVLAAANKEAKIEQDTRSLQILKATRDL